MKENLGFLILEKPTEMLRKYEERISERNFIEEYRKFRNTFAEFNPSNYLGISRNPLIGVPQNLQSVYEVIEEPDAQDYLSILDEHNLSSGDLIFEYSETIKTFTKIINKARYDIILVRKDTFEDNNNILGYDIGYWDGDHFSLIADTIVIPTWHGPIEEDYDELKTKLKVLNRNLLFNTFQEAEVFKNYYKSKSWAETEDIEGEFCIIQVQKVYYLLNAH
jgi:hypothetical protein